MRHIGTAADRQLRRYQDADAIQQNWVITRNKQREANAREWLRRAKVNIDEGHLTTAINQIQNAAIEWPACDKGPVT